MSSSKKNLIVDPDYEMSEMTKEHVRLREERENREKLEKVKEIVNREFHTELNHRLSQLDLIQQRLNQAQKTLHLLRYVLITSYYNENDKLVIKPNETSISTKSLISDQNRLHPAVKKLLENDLVDLNLAKTPRKKLKHSSYSKDKPKVNCTQVTQVNNVDKLSAEPEPLKNQSIETNKAVKNEKSSDSKGQEFDTSRNRKKFKYHIRVGNISKWNPSENEHDKSTHKWMVYVRGSKESPNISHIVRKVVFYIHPSYHPNDVIEIREAPFHLTRRGWGEFRVRVKLFFQCALNKPVDIYHDLKLDQTFSGRQQLANETVRDLFLYNDYTEGIVEHMDISTDVKEEPDIQNQFMEEDSICIKTEENADEGNVSNYEHDYCYSNIKEEIMQEFNADYDLALPSTSTSSPLQTYNLLMEHSYFQNGLVTKTNAETHNDCSLNECHSDYIYGIKETEETKSDLIVETVLDDIKIVPKPKTQYSIQRIIMNNGKVFEIRRHKKPQQSLLKKMVQNKIVKEVTNVNSKVSSSLQNFYKSNENSSEQSKSTDKNADNLKLIDYDKYKVDVPNNRFKSISEVLPYLFKRLPLISSLALDTDYKCTYPYAAKSYEEYSHWNIGRKLSSEWYQAKTVQKILNSLNLPDSKKWTTKALMMYARSHGYTPSCNYSIFKKNKSRIFEELANGITKKENGFAIDSAKPNSSKSIDDTIDVENCIAEPGINSVSNDKERLIDFKMGSACSYVKQAALDNGIVLKSEEIVPGVLYNATERMLLQASLCLAEDLIRRAKASLVLQGDFRETTSTIGVEEIKQALLQRTEFNILKKDVNSQ